MPNELPPGIRASVDPKELEAMKAKFATMGAEKLQSNIDAAEAILDSVFAAAKSGKDIDFGSDEVKKIEGFDGTTADVAAKIVEIHTELAACSDLLAVQHQAARVKDDLQAHREGAVRQVVDNLPIQDSRKFISLSDAMFAAIEKDHDSPIGPDFSIGDALKGAKNHLSMELSEVSVQKFMAEVLNTETATSHWEPFSTRQSGYVPFITRPIQLLDVFPMSTLNQHEVVYMQLTTRDSSNVAEVAEGAVSGEVNLNWTERREPVREIAAHIGMTEIQLEDESQVRSATRNELGMMLRQRFDRQILLGDGTGVNLSGVLTTRNGAAVRRYNFATTGAGANRVRSDILKDLRKAKRQTRWASYSMPNVYLLNPVVWEGVALSETQSAGFYLGSPANNFVERIWGLPVVETDHIGDAVTSNALNGVVLDTAWTRIWVRRGMHMEIGYNNDDFTKRQLTMRGALRAAVQVTRPEAISTINMPA